MILSLSIDYIEKKIGKNTKKGNGMKKISYLLTFSMIISLIGATDAYAIKMPLSKEKIKMLWRCRPDAASNQACTQEQRVQSKKWLIGGITTVGILALLTAAGVVGYKTYDIQKAKKAAHEELGSNPKKLAQPKKEKRKKQIDPSGQSSANPQLEQSQKVYFSKINELVRFYKNRESYDPQKDEERSIARQVAQTINYFPQNTKRYEFEQLLNWPIPAAGNIIVQDLIDELLKAYRLKFNLMTKLVVPQDLEEKGNFQFGVSRESLEKRKKFLQSLERELEKRLADINTNPKFRTAQKKEEGRAQIQKDLKNIENEYQQIRQMEQKLK